MKRAVTLTEVLVSITIFVILVALMWPTFFATKGRAAHAVCLSNIRQIVVALKLYQADHGEYPPNSVVWPAFRSYYPTVLHCPASDKTLPEFDYLVGASPLGDEEKGRRTKQAFLDCRQARGASFPLVLDINHLWRTSTGHVILGREDGSVHVIRDRGVVPGPCDSTILSVYHNY